MEQSKFEHLLVETACCCMVCDGDIADEEVALLKDVFAKFSSLQNVNLDTGINTFIAKVNEKGTGVLKEYHEHLSQADLSDEESLALIDIALQTIYADNVVEWSEIKFFKTIRFRLKISDEKILAKFPDIENFLEADIDTGTSLDNINDAYFKVIGEMPEFKMLTVAQ